MARAGDRRAGWSGGVRRLRLVLDQPLRQTEGALRSMADLLDVQIRIPDHTTFSRRGGGLKVLPQRIDRNEPLHLLIDSTGVKIYGEGEWLDQKHGVRSRRRWRKLHLAVDADTHEIAAVELTPDDVGDVSALPELLGQIEEPVGSVTADGAYDGVYDEVLHRHPAARVIIPPRSTAILSEAGTTQRDEHLRSIEQHGRLGWQRRSGYGRRSLVETAMYRYKTIVGRRLHAGLCSGQIIRTAKGGTQPEVYSCTNATLSGLPDLARDLLSEMPQGVF
jgi:hypothetical protein